MNTILVVVDNPRKWPFALPGVEVVSAREYLLNPHFSERNKLNVYNLCRSYRYQSLGYYVSLLASARTHKALPSIETIQDMKSLSISRLMVGDLDEEIQRIFKPLQSDQFTLSIYFGMNMAKRYDKLCKRLFQLFPSPFLRADFRKIKNEWTLHHIRPISVSDIQPDHLDFILESGKNFFSKLNHRISKRIIPQYDLAILVNPEEKNPPSNEKAIQKFLKAARKEGLGAELITRDDFGRLSQFDALFIRETTQVNHHTYRFSRFAEAEGIVVIDDPHSIRLCTNKVFLSELLGRYNIPQPKTLIVHKDNRKAIPATIGFPCILKQPDSSFSQGVFKAEDKDQLNQLLDRLLPDSELIIAQEYMPTDFDWRVGILNREPLYVCQYFMAEKHWQIQKNETNGETDYGRVTTLAVEGAPKKIISTALRAANLIGDGLYGIDIKQSGSNIVVIEINDNPSIDHKFEDDFLKDELYKRVMSVFKKRIEGKKKNS